MPVEVIFVLVISTVFMSLSPLWSTDHDSWPWKRETGSPSSPARVALTDGISIMYPAPSPTVTTILRVMSSFGSVFQEGKSLQWLVRFTVDEGGTMLRG